MSLYGLLKIKPDPSLHDIEEAFDGNLCRCTGYRPILDSARSFIKNNEKSSFNSKIDFDQFKDYDPNDDLSFPTALTKLTPKSTVLLGDESSIWIRPTNLDELLEIKEIWPNSRLIGGNTEVGVEMSMRPLNQPSEFVYVGDLSEMRDVKVTSRNTLEIGVNITLTELITALKNLKKTSPIVHYRSLFNAFLSNLRWFASRHIRNFSTLAGNITTGSPISDLNPILVANDALLTVASKQRGERTIPMREFFLAYRKIDLATDEIVIKVSIPLPKSAREIVYAYKQAKRKTDDIALVNGCFRVKLTENNLIDELDVSLGGVSSTTIYLGELSEKSKGMVWGDEKALKCIEGLILDEVRIEYSAPGAHPTYRRVLVGSFLTRFWHQSIRDLNRIGEKNNIDEIERGISTSSHDLFSSKHEPHLGSRDPHVASLLHTTGMATYCDDLPRQQDELFAWPVLSTRSHANIVSIDESKALELKGVHGFVSHKDVMVSGK